MPYLIAGVHYDDCPFYYEGSLSERHPALCVWCMAHDRARR